MSAHYKIYSTNRQKIITTDDIVTDMKDADVLFFGEEHNDSTAHYLEFDLLKKLSAKYPGKTTLSMEMFETDCQVVLDEYLNGLIREKNFLVDARVWPNYKDYRPMVEFAKQQHLSVIAANAPARYTNMTNRMGLASLMLLSTTAKSFLPPLPIDTAIGAYYKKFSDLMGGHSSMPGMQMYQAQNLWDATMGWSMANFYKQHAGFKILHLNGNFHSEEKLGAAAQLKQYAPNVKILNIALYSDDNFNKPDWKALAKNVDYIILTDPDLAKTY